MAMPSKKKLLEAKDFGKALKQLDHEMSQNEFLTAFAPINVVTIGGFLAVTFFKNRESTGDLDYMIEPQWAEDDEIKSPLEQAIISVAMKEDFEFDWMNDDVKIWATPTAYKTIFKKAYEQNIILFDGKSLKIWAALLEWALERKLRRIAYSDRGDKKVDMEDALALIRHFRKANGRPLDMEYFRKLNINGFDLTPETHHMEMVATKYQHMYKEDLFFFPNALETSSTTVPAGGSGVGDWSKWMWIEQYKCNYRCRQNAKELNGLEYEYDQTTATLPVGSSQQAGLL